VVARREWLLAEREVGTVLRPLNDSMKAFSTGIRAE
jgi:hypothetical protein